MSEQVEWPQPAMDARIRYRRAENALWRAAGNGVLVLAAGALEPVAVVGAGLALWDLLTAPLTANEAAAMLAQRFAISEEDVLRAIEPVLGDLFAAGALDVVGP